MFSGRMAFCRGLGLSALLLSCVSTSGVRAAPLTPAFMPQPAKSTVSGRITVFSVRPQVIWAQPPTPLLKRALLRFEARLNQIGIVSDPAANRNVLLLKINAGTDPDYLSLNMREAYTLETGEKEIVLNADGPAGVIHGFATLLQMIDTHGAVPGLLQGRIVDAPRFRWRGIMLDASRHFQSLDTLKRQLDAMELTKFNVLHWHLSDGTGFRVESKRLPLLHRSGSHSQYYTQDQVREIIAYAADRGIRIVPEFDVPGHTLSMLAAYPELAAQQPVPTVQDWQQDCQVKSGNDDITTRCTRRSDLNLPAMNPTSDKVISFARTLFGEMAALFPDRYFHTGGDEVVARQWNDNPQIVAYMKTHGFADASSLQAAFTAKIEKLLSADGKIMMGWDEVSEAPIPHNVVVEAWRGSKWIGTATRLGHPVVVSSGYYLDLLTDSARHYGVDPYDTRADGLAPGVLGAGAKPVPRAFMLDPMAPPLDEAQKKLVLGGEAPLWTEVVSDEMVDARLWPRAAVIAERYWSPQTVTDRDALIGRLPEVLNFLECFGLQASDHQARMIARLTPQNIVPLTQLVALTVPVRNYALNRQADRKGERILLSPAAIASPDSFEGNEFNALAARYAAGERDVAGALREKLMRYRSNDVAFQALTGPDSVNEVKPLSSQIAALSDLGIEALQPGRKGKAWQDHAAALLADQDRAYAASRDHQAANHLPQPAGGVLIAIVPGIKVLVASTK